MSTINRKISSYSGGDNSCVAVGREGNRVLIQDSKQDAEYTRTPAQQPTIVFDESQWPAVRNLTLSTSSGEVHGALTIELHANGAATFVGVDAQRQPVELEFNVEEMDAFAKGVADGEFDQSY